MESLTPTMADNGSGNPMPGAGDNPAFQTTHWSVVLQAASGDSRAALERLCGVYWYPLYVFARRNGNGPDESQDLTQGFFELLLAKDYLKGVDRDKGKFRSFLLVSFKHFIANERKKAATQKRGGSIQTISFDAMEAEERYHLEPTDTLSADIVYDRCWARAVLDTVLAKLRQEFEQAGKRDRFDSLSAFLFLEPEAGRYAALAQECRITESALRSSVQRTRQRYAALFRMEIANTVKDPRDIEGEIAHLASTLSL